ncbi:hypothetical protein BU14_0526s0006 [Porphyra umbilicalis]|uniref:ABC1 atypical kinase-like domain-containing protein n=1 Tax=Porphyra umbilicalis TaxID=2786 RepID=A0A1X6NSF3_PORUM|nr:hypothetical protein BU14_0526s0006 [Porphyra umbilicalis]|eukprot:OSX71505.1 hypothetical protein BU14_0526s0006 [Porphyra umbilicalis]
MVDFAHRGKHRVASTARIPATQTHCRATPAARRAAAAARSIPARAFPPSLWWRRRAARTSTAPSRAWPAGRGRGRALPPAPPPASTPPRRQLLPPPPPGSGAGPLSLPHLRPAAAAAAVARAGAFWAAAARVYGAYKLTGVRAAAAAVRAGGGAAGRDAAAAVWARQHAWAGRAMRGVCVGLGGFYAKAGQFLATRVDFVPLPICRALHTVHTELPPFPAGTPPALLDAAFPGHPLTDLSAEPIAVASVAQVHTATTRGGGGGDRRHPPTPVIVKFARPGGLATMAADMANVGALARLLTITDIPFDLSGAVAELRAQLAGEFDLAREAAVLSEVGGTSTASRGGGGAPPAAVAAVGARRRPPAGGRWHGGGGGARHDARGGGAAQPHGRGGGAGGGGGGAAEGGCAEP